MVIKGNRVMDLNELTNELELCDNTLVRLSFGKKEVANQIYIFLELVQGRKVELFPETPKRRAGWTIFSELEPDTSA